MLDLLDIMKFLFNYPLVVSHFPGEPMRLKKNPLTSNMDRLGNLVDFLCLARFQLDPLGRPLRVFIGGTASGIVPARCSDLDFLEKIEGQTRLVYHKLGLVGESLEKHVPPRCPLRRQHKFT